MPKKAKAKKKATKKKAAAKKKSKKKKTKPKAAPENKAMGNAPETKDGFGLTSEVENQCSDFPDIDEPFESSNFDHDPTAA